MPPRLVRRRPLMERIKAQLDPMDFLLWLSEEIETRDWDSKLIGTQIGLAMNFAFLLARANSGGSRKVDAVFEDEATASGWFTFAAGTLVWLLIGLSGLNAFHTMYRSRHYRLFEADVEQKPSTPSARRVKATSPPVSSSPLRLLTDLLSTESAESRAHPDATRDVWEINVWDPLPISLRIFCLFSPGHVLVYMMCLPLAPLEVRPSVTVFNCILTQVILSAQLMLFQTRFTQQSKDTAVIQKEVMNEYDTKFVHPRLFPTVRDVGTQLAEDDDGNMEEFVAAGPATVQLKRGFHTRPNPNYAKLIDPDSAVSTPMNNPVRRGLFTPSVSTKPTGSFGSELKSRPLAARPPRRHTPAAGPISQPTPRRDASTASTAGSGGYLGVYTNPTSPLKKAPSLGELQFRSPRNNGEMAQLEQYQSYQRERSASPMKNTRKSTGTTPSLNPNPPNPWPRRHQAPYERYPSMFQ
ncbi:hypothetical protein F4780DRAFT_164241 [Xylariomycetidae sp. FL0641]|nr:hypothetical protein F4780DRAFT_164241 [Xylariomycetidae sp. FL0641]